MSQQLAYVIITPYSLFKSRTGGILSRLLTRTALDLVAARADSLGGSARRLAAILEQVLSQHATKLNGPVVKVTKEMVGATISGP